MRRGVFAAGVLGAGVLGVGACAEPVVLTPAEVAPRPPAREVAFVPTIAAPAVAGFAVVTGPPPPVPEDPVRLEIERPYKLDARPPSSDRERWNKGDLGDLAAPLPPVSGHPLPRVIVDVESSKGGHKAADVQREARRLFWIHVVGCFGAGAHKDQTLHGKTRIRFQLSRAGKVSGVRLLDTKLADPDVAKCLVDDWKGLALPKAKSGSTVVAAVQVFPGDEPIPPPGAMITAGDGVIDADGIAAAVNERAPDFQACYRAALTYAPRLWGRLAVRFHVTAAGQVDEAFEGDSHFPDERVTLCVLHAARALRLPPPKGGDARFVVPLRLSTPEAPPR